MPSIPLKQGCGNTMPDLSNLVPVLFIPDKLKTSIYLSLDKYKCIKLIQFCISYFDYYELTSCIENSVDPDQLASSGSTLFTMKPADQEPY